MMINDSNTGADDIHKYLQHEYDSNKNPPKDLEKNRDTGVGNSPLVTTRRPTFAQNYPLPWTDPQTQVPASSVHLSDSDLPSKTTSTSYQPFGQFGHNAIGCGRGTLNTALWQNALDRQTDTQTNRWVEGMFDD